MSNQFADYRREIMILRAEEKYYDLLKMCNMCVRECNDYMDFWFTYHNFSKAYEGLKDFDMAIKYEIKALTYIKDEEWRETEQSYSLWQLAECNKQLGNIDRAIFHYKELSKVYRKIGAYKQRICMIANYAGLKKDEKALSKIIKIYQSDWFKPHLQIEKIDSYNQLDEVLVEMYNMLIGIHKEQNQIDKIFLVINSIKDDSIRKLMFKHIKVQSIEQIS